MAYRPPGASRIRSCFFSEVQNKPGQSIVLSFEVVCFVFREAVGCAEHRLVALYAVNYYVDVVADWRAMYGPFFIWLRFHEGRWPVGRVVLRDKFSVQYSVEGSRNDREQKTLV